ncbi:Chromosome partition protein smc [Dissulfuribacter thermophilus]|uniref:Chromosome partition protein Smc n=2 Tax=Dissulfuribacter thermophilus TaxID=1156395 RepID=A0A1B9F511_9BACT|nr:Chromosome partition protein smc [Dissulfuribacter thermophilus]
MKLKRLVIRGFKSFPDRTILSFPSQGVSAIVGPNGCGKSNILDAIRWVLGEQSPKMLRARSMDEVIYSGPNGRGVGYAEVKMVLEEVGGKKSVEIARRLYKSGETNYLLDGRPVRLKDIQYLFMDTGSGTRAYALVDQGQVSRFVEMGPEERKTLIEEAAGISKYKQKRRETEVRLKKTLENIERLNDILTEVKRERKEAKRDAEVALKYQALKADYHKVKKAILGSTYKKYIEKKEEIEVKLKDIRLKVLALDSDLGRIHSSLSRLEDEVFTLEERYNERSEEEKRLSQQLREHKLKTEQREEHLRRLTDDLRERELRIKDISHRTKGLISKKESLKERIHLKNDQIRLLEGKINELVAAKRDVEALVLEIKEELESLKDRFVDVSSNLARKEGELKASLKQKAEIQNRISKIQQKILELSKREKILTQELEDKNERYLALKLEQDSLSQKIQDIQAELKEIQEKEREIKQKFEKVSQDLGVSTQRMTALSEIVEGGLDLFESTRRFLKELKRKDIPFKGILVDFLNIEPGKERIVEKALSEVVLQGILFENKDTMKAAKDLLSEMELDGPIWLFWMEEKAESEPSMEKDAPLLSFIDAPHDVLPPILRRLSGLKPSNNMWIDGDGEALFLGKEVEKGDGLIERRAELLSLKNKVAELQKEYNSLKKALEEVLVSRQEKEKRLKEIRTMASKNRDESIKLEASLVHLKKELQGFKDRLQGLRLEKSALELDYKEMEGTDGLLQERVEALRKQLADIQGKLDERKQALADYEKVLKSRDENISQLKQELTKERTMLEGSERDLNGVEKALRKLEKERVSLDSEISKAREQIERQRNDLFSAKDLISKNEVRLYEIQEAKEEVYRGLRSIRDKIANLSKEKADLEAKRRKLVEALHASELSLSRVLERMNSVNDEAKEAFSQDIEEVWEEWASLMHLAKDLNKELKRLKKAMDSLGPVNHSAVDKLKELDERVLFLEEQLKDLEGSYRDLKEAISKIDSRCRLRLKDAIKGINEQLEQVFSLLFEGGSARLSVSGEERDILDVGIDFMVKLPGKSVRSLNLLSGGEKALSALSLIFSIFFLKPAPFCVLDEVDAALDEANCLRFARLLKEVAKRSQVILITHNPRVMEAADCLFGVTMEEKGVSKLVSVRLESFNA